MISEIGRIKNSDKNTIDITLKDGTTHYLKIGGLTQEDQLALESELKRISPFDMLYCFVCQSPMNKNEQKCSKCGWTFSPEIEDT